MSDAKHTPEKWTYTIERVGLGNTRIIQADGTHIATAWFPPVEDDSIYPVSIIKAVGWMLEAANACAGMADPAAEIAEMRAENDRLRRYVGDEMIRSDFKTAAQMRSQLEHYRAEATALRRNEAEAIDAIKSVGYTTPHGESDSLGEAVAWLVGQIRKERAS